MKTHTTVTTQPETPATNTPSAGAMRAAKKLEWHGAIAEGYAENTVAHIIDRETAHAELVAALELALKGLELACEKNLPEFIGFALAADKARVALARAQA